MPDIKAKTWAAGEALTASLLNTYVRDNVTGLLQPAKQLVNVTHTTNLTTSSGSMVDVSTTWYQAQVTPNIEAGLTCDILIGAYFSLRCSSDGTARVVNLDLMVNGISVSGGAGVVFAEGTSAQVMPVTITHLLTAQDNSLKTIKLRWSVSGGGTAVLFTDSSGTRSARSQFWARVL